MPRRSWWLRRAWTKSRETAASTLGRAKCRAQRTAASVLRKGKELIGGGTLVGEGALSKRSIGMSRPICSSWATSAIWSSREAHWPSMDKPTNRFWPSGGGCFDHGHARDRLDCRIPQSGEKGRRTPSKRMIAALVRIVGPPTTPAITPSSNSLRVFQGRHRQIDAGRRVRLLRHVDDPKEVESLPIFLNGSPQAVLYCTSRGRTGSTS